MAKTQTRKSAYNTTAYRDNARYIEGNVAVKSVQQELETPLRPVNPRVSRNRRKAMAMSAGYVFFLTIAVAVIAMTAVFYITLQSEISNNVKTISSLESELNNLRLDNDEAYSRATGNIDLEEVKRIAIGELGMTYATEGQIITYSNAGSDYVKQVADIP